MVKILLCIFCIILSVNLIDSDTWFNKEWKIPLQKSVSSEAPSFFAGSIVGFRNISTDLLWIDTIQYIGNNENSKEGFKKFYSYVKQIIALDPHFTYAYLFGSSILMWQLNRSDDAMEIIKEGIANNPDYWQLNLYLAAFTYFKANEYKKMVVYLEHALNIESHPPMLERILGNIYEKIGEIEKARLLWWWMWYNTKDIENKKYAEKKLKERGFWYQ